MKCFSDGTDTVVAASEHDAYAVWKEWCGADYHDADPFARLLELPADKVLAITTDDGPDGHEKRTQTCAEWAKENGRGFLCSTEF